MDPENLRFLKLIEASGWSQAQAARELGITRGAVWQYLEGTSKPKETVLRLFELLLNPEAKVLEAVKDSGSYLDPKEEQLFRDLRDLKTNDREKVITAMRHMISVMPKEPKKKYPNSKHGRAQSPMTDAEVDSATESLLDDLNP